MKCVGCNTDLSTAVCDKCGFDHRVGTIALLSRVEEENVSLPQTTMISSSPSTSSVAPSTTIAPSAPTRRGHKRKSSRNIPETLRWNPSAISIIIFAVIIILSICFWPVGQWVLGIVVAVLVVRLVAHSLFSLSVYYIYSPYLWVLGELSVLNVALVLVMPSYYSTAVLPVALGNTVASFLCVVFAYSYETKAEKRPAVVFFSLNLAVAITGTGRLAFFFPAWIIYLLLAVVFGWIVGKVSELIYRHVRRYKTRGLLCASTVAGVLVAAYIILIWFFPHFAHLMRADPDHLECDTSYKRVSCSCGEEIEVSEFAAGIIHGETCEYTNMWNQLESASYRFDENHHWTECACGYAVADNMEHDYENGVCKVCGYKKAD